MKRTISVRLAATGAAAALAFTGLGLGAAFAADADGNNGAADASSIDLNAAKSLTIHKFTPSTVTAENDGRELPENGKALKDAGAKPIDGIKFKIRKITNIDMTKNEGWKQAEEVAKAFKENKTEAAITGLTVCGNGTEACALGAPTEQPTANGGVTKFENLEPGYYLVEENLAGSDPVEVVGDPTITKDKIVSADPFLVSVPLTNPVNKKEWLYDVHVYPKNSTAGIEKEVKDQNTPGAGNDAKGSKITYTITTDIPAGVKELKNYTVIDPLNKKLEYLGTGKVIVATKDSNNKIDDVTLTEGAGNDYEIITHDLNNEKTGTVVTLRFTDTGRAKLISARDTNKATRVIWDLNANLKKTTVDGESQYEIPNTATLFPPNKPNNEWDPNDPTDTPPGTDTPPVYSKYGKVTITKKGSGKKDSEKLNGAKFQLFLCNAEGDILNYKDDAHPKLAKKAAGETNEAFLKRVEAAKISVNNKTEWVSGTDGVVAEDGKIVIDGLQLNDWENDKSKTGVTGKVADPDWYCLVETEAPAKYELLPEPIKFQLLEGSNTAGPDEAPTYNVKFDVKNVPSNGGFELPVTGGQGIALLVTAGGLLVAGSVAYTVAASRKRKQQA